MQRDFSRRTMGYEKEWGPFDKTLECERDFHEWYLGLKIEELMRAFQTGDRAIIDSAFPTWRWDRDPTKFSMALRENTSVQEAHLQLARILRASRLGQPADKTSGEFLIEPWCEALRREKQMIRFIRYAKQPPSPRAKQERADPTPIYVEDRKLKAYLRSYRP